MSDLRRAEAGLGDAADADAPSAEPARQAEGVVPDSIEADLQPRRAHEALAVAVISISGKACTTMSTRRSTGRVERVGGGQRELELIASDRLGDLEIGHVLVVDRHPDHLRVSKGLQQVDLAGWLRGRHVGEVTEADPCGCVLQDHAVGLRPAQDEGGAQVRRVAERALTLDDDHLGVLTLVGIDHRCFHLTRAELAGQGVEGDAVASALDQPGLAGADHDRLDPPLVEGLGQDGGGRALAHRAVGAEHGDPHAGHVVDPSGEHAKVLLVARTPHVQDRHAVPLRRRLERRIVVQELVQSVDEADALVHRVEQKSALGAREHAARGRHAEDQVVRRSTVAKDGVRQIGHHRDLVRAVAEDLAGVETRLGAVDDREDLIALRVPDEAVGRLAVWRAEVRLAVDHGRRAQVLDGGVVARADRAWRKGA